MKEFFYDDDEVVVIMIDMKEGSRTSGYIDDYEDGNADDDWDKRGGEVLKREHQILMLITLQFQQYFDQCQ